MPSASGRRWRDRLALRAPSRHHGLGDRGFAARAQFLPEGTRSKSSSGRRPSLRCSRRDLCDAAADCPRTRTTPAGARCTNPGRRKARNLRLWILAAIATLIDIGGGASTIAHARGHRTSRPGGGIALRSLSALVGAGNVIRSSNIQSPSRRLILPAPMTSRYDPEDLIPWRHMGCSAGCADSRSIASRSAAVWLTQRKIASAFHFWRYRRGQIVDPRPTMSKSGFLAVCRVAADRSAVLPSSAR